MSMTSWSTTPANNVLANTGFTMDEGMAPSAVNDSIRQLMADVRKECFLGANVASATTTDLSTATGSYVHITGTTTITGLGTLSAGIIRYLEFDGALTLTHNGTSLILPGGVNITTVAKDVGIFVSLGSGNWKCISYVGQSGNLQTLTLSGALTLAAAGAFASPIAKVGSFTRVTNAVDGGVSYTGVGFKPSVIIFVNDIDTTSAFGIGFDDGTSHKCFYYNANNSLAFVGTTSIRIEDGGGSNYESGVIAAFDADGFTITWTKSGTPSGNTANIAYMAFR